VNQEKVWAAIRAALGEGSPVRPSLTGVRTTLSDRDGTELVQANLAAGSRQWQIERAARWAAEALFLGMREALAELAPSFWSFELVEWRFSTRRGPHLSIRNRQHTVLDFDGGPPAGAPYWPLTEAARFIVNAETAYWLAMDQLKSARDRSRSDLVSRITEDLAVLVSVAGEYRRRDV